MRDNTTGLPARLVFIRHGQLLRNYVKRGATYLTEDGRDLTQRVSDVDNPLTDEGHRQSRATGEALRKRFGAPDTVFHSGYQRTMRTAHSILEAFSADERDRVAVHQHFFLRERDIGYAFNMTAEEAEQAFPWLHDYWQTHGAFYARPPGGESLAEVAQRAYLFMEELRRRRAGDTVFIVTHGGIMRCFRFVIEQWTHDTIQAAQSPLNCAVTAYRYDADRKGYSLEMSDTVFWRKTSV